jgi:hypothetical protein
VFVSRGRLAWHGPRLSRRQRLAMQGGDMPCEAETCHARQRLVGGDPSSGELVGDAPDWSGTGRLAGDGLDRGPHSSPKSWPSLCQS